MDILMPKFFFSTSTNKRKSSSWRSHLFDLCWSVGQECSRVRSRPCTSRSLHAVDAWKWSNYERTAILRMVHAWPTIRFTSKFLREARSAINVIFIERSQLDNAEFFFFRVISFNGRLTIDSQSHLNDGLNLRLAFFRLLFETPWDVSWWCRRLRRAPRTNNQRVRMEKCS